MHLSKISVSNGQTVDAGDLIGEMGTTGASTGTHLHIQIWDIAANQYIDPNAYLKE